MLSPATFEAEPADRSLSRRDTVTVPGRDDEKCLAIDDPVERFLSTLEPWERAILEVRV